MSISNGPNIRISQQENEPIEDLGHRRGKGKWIPDKELEDLARDKYYKNGTGLTYVDLIQRIGCSKPKAQRRLKRACIEKIDRNGRKTGILFTLANKRTSPQNYFPTCIKARIIENKAKRGNELIGTTGVTSNNKTLSSNYHLDNALLNQITSYFVIQLSLLPFQSLQMHNIHLWIKIDKSHYDELSQKPSFNQTKTEKERIGFREIIYKFNKSGSIQIDIACSRNPIKIETDDDVYSFFVFLGQVKDRMAIILSDVRERIVPPVDSWILKSCDFNKDVEINENENIGQIMKLNIQIKHVGRAFRLYVNMDDKFVLRGEKTGKINQPITTFLNDSIITPLNLIDNRFNELYDIIRKNHHELKERFEEDRGKNVLNKP